MKSSLNVRKGLDAVTSGDSNRGSVGAIQTANDKGLARPRTATTVQTPHSDNSGQERLEQQSSGGALSPQK